MSKRQLEEQQERESVAWIASELGITPDELADQEYDIDETTGRDGAVYGHTVTFREGSDPEVLAKIEGIQDGHWVRIGFMPDEHEPERPE